MPTSAANSWDTGIVVAIDGPSVSGKSSAFCCVAIELGLGYLDARAQYRAITGGT